MYADNARNRMLAVFMALVAATSMGFNVKQLFDISYYKNLASETQEVLQSISPVKAMPSLAVLRTVAVSKSELQCMSENIYYEAATQSLIGKIAVGQVVLNRMHKPNYPSTACGVINQRLGGTCMFSWKCSEPVPIKTSKAWTESQQVAYDLLSRDRKDMVDITEGATHFHGTGVSPGWKLRKVAKIDDHLFYK